MELEYTAGGGKTYENWKKLQEPPNGTEGFGHIFDSFSKKKQIGIMLPFGSEPSDHGRLNLLVITDLDTGDVEMRVVMGDAAGVEWFGALDAEFERGDKHA